MKVALFDPGIEDNLGTPSSNLGDLIIQDAVNRELKLIFPHAEIFRISTQARMPRHYFPQLKEYDRVIVGGTNLLSSFMRKYKQWQIRFKDAVRIQRAMLLGVGWWQYQKPPDLRTRLTLLAALSWHGQHSVRDEYTRKQLAAAGLRNVLNTGCPTMWPFLDFDQSTVPSTKADRALLMITDYLRKSEQDVALIKLLLSSYREVYFWPQGRKDLEYMNELGLPVRRLEHTMGALKDFVANAPPFDYIGTRLHGGVFCLLHKRRSLILEVDNRAKEIAQDTGLPTAPRNDLAAIARWIQGPTTVNIRMNRTAIEAWRQQFQLKPGAESQAAARAKRNVRLAAMKRPLPKLLNLGCGGHFQTDWVNVDIAARDERIIEHDLLKPLPFEDASFSVVYHSHVLEHLPKGRVEAFLTECHRVLEPGGILRVVVPDLESITRLYLKYLDAAVAGDLAAPERHEWMTLELLDQMTREESGGETFKFWRRHPMPALDFVMERTGKAILVFRDHIEKKSLDARKPAPPLNAEQVAAFRQSGEVHRWMYDRFSLQRLLERCGFSEIKVCQAAESRIENFNSYQLDLTPEGATRKPDSLFMEAIRPREDVPAAPAGSLFRSAAA